VVTSVAASGEWLFGEAGGRLFIVDSSSPPRPVPLNGRVLDIASDGRRLWMLRLSEKWPEIDQLDSGMNPHRVAECRFSAAHLSWASGKLWVGGFAENGMIDVKSFSSAGDPGPAWSLPLEGLAPLDDLEREVLQAAGGGNGDVLLEDYEMAAFGDGITLVFRRRNLILVLPSSGGAPRSLRWPSITRSIEELIRHHRNGKHSFPLGPLVVVSAVVGLGGDGLLLVEPRTESDLAAFKAYLTTGARPTPRSGKEKRARATLMWLSGRGTIRKSWRLSWRPTAMAVRDGRLEGVALDGHVRALATPGCLRWSRPAR